MRSSLIIVAVVALIWGLHNWSSAQALVCEERVVNARNHLITRITLDTCNGYLSDYRRLKRQRWYIKGLIIDNCPQRYNEDLKVLDKGQYPIHFDDATTSS